MKTNEPPKQQVTQLTPTKPPIIRDILLKENYVTEEDLKKADEYAKKNNSSVVDYLKSQGLLTRELLGQALAESYGLQFADLSFRPPTPEQIAKIPEQIAIQYRVVFFSDSETRVILASDNPHQSGMHEVLKSFFPKKELLMAYALPEDIDQTLLKYKKPLETRFNDIIAKGSKVASEIIDEIFKDALSLRASDIHFEPEEKDVMIRFRIDGVLKIAGRIPKNLYENILNRIKVLSHLRTDDHFSAQDGAIRYENNNISVDMRVSVLPTFDGEKVVIRLLSAYVKSFTFADLGLSAENQTILEENARKPFGMILVTGPTGSGKTTTLYGLIKMLNNPEVNITTIEDPVEYRISGINQIQVNTQTNLTFAKGLRSIVRQDPNIILVGEIRDKETAEIAVNAALTGHLLLSTFHANDASTAVPRLLEIGLEPFLLVSTLELIIAQRLVRKICEVCRYSVTANTDKVKQIYPQVSSYLSSKTMTLYMGKGCKVCGNSGYKGRNALFEFIAISGEMEELMLKNPSAQQIWELAQKQGSVSLFEDGIEKVKNGLTTFDELLRVATPPALYGKKD